MIQEPSAAELITTYENESVNLNNQSIVINKRTESTASTNCGPTILPQTVATTIPPIVIETNTDSKIILIRVPTTNRAINYQQQGLQEQEKKLLASVEEESKKPQTRIIRIPFLPGLEPIIFSVKKNSQTPNVSVKHSFTDRRQSPTVNTWTDTDYQATAASNLTTIIQEPIKDQNTTTTTKTIQEQEEVSIQPMTLASMAGIQLTSADISHQDMSGAMPTATVEEINVPVFIDEYLQQFAPPTSTTTSTATESAINQSNSNNACGTDLCIEDVGRFEDFEFDFDLIAEDIIEEEMYQSNNKNNSNIYNSGNLFLDDYNFSSTINMTNNCNSIIVEDNDENCSNNIIENKCPIELGMVDFGDNCYLKTELKIKNEDEIERQFHISPGTLLLGEDDFTNQPEFLSMEDMSINEDAVNFSEMNNDFLLSDCLASSQQNPVMAETICFSANNSQTVLTNAEPLLPDYDEFDSSKFSAYTNSQPTLLMPIICDDLKTEMYEDEPVDSGDVVNTTSTIAAVAATANINCGLALKRLAANRVLGTSATMAEKRRKLHLDTSRRITNNNNNLSTPDVVKLIDDMSNDECFFKPKNNNESAAECYSQIFSAIMDDVVAIDDNSSGESYSTFSDDVVSPYTPQSCISNSSFTYTSNTNFTTAPTSPAPSTPSSTVASQQNSKKRRGRPAKLHSDPPNEQFLSQCNESQRKSLLDRYKNNEASRLSRQKNKERETREIEEETALMQANSELQEDLQFQEHQVKKLKRALARKSKLYKR